VYLYVGRCHLGEVYEKWNEKKKVLKIFTEKDITFKG
jgi:hypothetical protein